MEFSYNWHILYAFTHSSSSFCTKIIFCWYEGANNTCIQRFSIKTLLCLFQHLTHYRGTIDRELLTSALP